MGEWLKFIFGGKLPTYYDAAISILTECLKPKTSKMLTTASVSTDALVEMSLKSFSEEHMLIRKAEKKKVEKLVEHYCNNVYVEVHR